MQRQRIKRADRVETAMRRAAPAHIVFRVDFEKPEARTRVEDRLEMLGLEPDADARRGQDPRSMTIGDGHGASPRASRLASIVVFAGVDRHVTSNRPFASKQKI